MKKNLLVFLLFHLCGIALAQTTIRGRVTSARGGEPLPGVSVVVKGTTAGASTDVDGNFQIQAPTSATALVFSYIGFISKEEPINGRTTVNVSLQEDARALEEVVVVGYGTQLRREVTTAISSVTPEEITQTPITRVEQALQGRVAGVQTTNISGQPGDAPTIRIRGIGSTGISSPIYVVDGFIVGGIDYLNPGDIEKIDVLKDAAAAAIYGARAGNGVVMITTKQGVRDGDMHVSYDGYAGIQNPWRKLKLLDAREYAIMMNEGAMNAGQAPKFPDVNQFSGGTDWQDAVFEKNALITNHQLTISGGTAKSGYAAAFSYFDQDGIVGGDKSNFKRYTARINADNQVKEFLKVGTNLSYTHINRRSFDANQEFGGILSNAINLDPLTPIYETDPDILNNAPYSSNPVVRDANGVFAISRNVAQEVVNPLARLHLMNGVTTVDKFVGNGYAEIKIIEGLSFRSSFSIDLAYVNTTGYSPIYYLNEAQKNSTSSVSRSTDRYYTWQNDNYFSYNKTFGDHKVEATVGSTFLQGRDEGLYGSNTGLVTTDPRKAYLNLATDTESARATGGASERSLVGVFGRVNYSFKEKYQLSASLRRDGSSRVGKNNPYTTYPAVSVGWILSEEPFFPQIASINFFKIRASWGQNGNEELNGDYPTSSPVGVGRGYTFYTENGSGYISGSSLIRNENPDLRWETVEQTNVGIDLSFLNNAFTFTADYYVKTTKDLLIFAPIRASVGLDPYAANGGAVRNSGLELALTYQNKVGGLGYSLGLNGSLNKNEVLYINNAEQLLTGGSYSTYGVISRAEPGYPIGYFYGYKTDGIFQNQSEVEAHAKEGSLIQPLAQPGDARFVDLNNDGTIDDKDRTSIGNPTPKVVGGFNLGLDFKNFDLSAFFYGAFGHQIFNGTRRYDLPDANMQTRFLNRWTGEGTTNEYPRFTRNDTNGNYTRPSDLYIEDGDFVRLKTLQLGYNLPSSVLTKLHIQKLRVYVSADNLLTFTNYSGFDPEIGARGSIDIGVDRGVYPQSKTFRFGFNVTF
ncbi:TonB-dependent receptor [Rufibacter immobilis]|uniref:TonB-dependent receptor n=1 Tax=Rufibacter immobilis TaxID=1348778 RepID=A0A3M9MW39_9BACT|nr:TonB-dependent receptor [Rufibacter immobilis]RNI29746.1 TonB-dependent receptor [Rufibacter immobilis]